VGSVVLYERTGVDLRVPCLFRLLTGHACPGCGLTHALGDLLRGDAAAAWSANPLIFVLLPAGLWYSVLEPMLRPPSAAVRAAR
jgi:hypothetical protein